MLNKKTTCAFTGHRPEKLNFEEKEAKKLLCNAIEAAVNSGYTTFITGMAPGIDVWAAEIVLEFKAIYPQIEIVCALPYSSFCNSRMSSCGKILSSSSYTYTAYPTYTPYSFHTRNMWMVDNSSRLIAFFNGSTGGTFNTVNYAKKQGTEIINLL